MGAKAPVDMKNTIFDLFARHAVAPLLLHTKTLVALLAADGALLEWNPAFGQVKESLPEAKHLQDFLALAARADFVRLLHATAQKLNEGRGELPILTGKDFRNYACLLIPVPSGNFLWLAEPIIETQSEEVARLTNELSAAKHSLALKQAGLDSVMAQAQEIINTDQLTFLANQRKIVGDLQRSVISYDVSQKPLTIFMLDIDRFKGINDTYGHMAGDHVLRTLSNLLRNSLRQADVIGRYGGEEFLILLPDTSLESAIPTAERLLNVARNMTAEVANQVIRATVSIGMAEYQPGETWKEFLDRADQALYESKRNGRNRWSAAQMKK